MLCPKPAEISSNQKAEGKQQASVEVDISCL
ncbi:MAG: hypothetical protein JWN42_785, partial [Candidatus Angelobacter sp.]|nr:hypothetical protein [Candidatus Angelobacter sp.]